MQEQQLDVLHHLGSKVESCVYRSLNFQVNYEVAPVVRPILPDDLLTSKGSASRV